MAGEVPSLYDGAMKFPLPGSKMLGNAIEKNPSRTDVSERDKNLIEPGSRHIRPRL
jgi:hypothetical protein